ncbi:M24 family metallopeptidase [Raoultella planticola]
MKPAWQFRPGPDIATTPPMGLFQAQALAKSAAQVGLAALKPGVSEREIERVIHDYLYQQNATGIWTITTVGLGENARVCFPTHGPGELTAQEKDVLIVDVHPITEQGFWGDCTRTRVIGHYPEADQALIDLERIHQQTLTLCRPGMPAGELFEISHQQLLKEGFILLDLLGNIGHSLGAGSAYTEGFIDASNNKPMWGAWAIEPFAQRGDVAVKVEDLVWFGRDNCTVL